jgi:hypothetical protein
MNQKKDKDSKFTTYTNEYLILQSFLLIHVGKL